MKRKVKITTIGGGSSYTPELIEGFIKRYESLPISEMWLVDVEEGKEKLEIVASLAQRMWDASGYKVKVYATLDRKEALKDADFVTTQFRVGQLEARMKDERIPAYYGFLGQETNGAGGIFKALRTVPVILDIIEDMKKYCPDAYLINFTNPSGMITEAIIRYGKWDKTIGLCNVPIVAIKEEPALIGKKENELIYRFAGLNHFHWHKVYDLEGKDRTLEIARKLMDSKKGLPKNIFDVPFFMEQLDDMNMIPCGYHRYYYREEEMLNHALEEYKTIGTRAEQVREIEEQLFELYKNPDLDKKPELLSERGGAYYSDAACEIINSIYNNKNTQMVVSTKNNGAIKYLPDDCVVEVTSLIGSKGATPLAFADFSPAEIGILQLMKNMELTVLDAAVTGSYGKLLQAFIINPLIRSGETSKTMLDEMLVANKKHLKNFKATIEKLEASGVEIKDEKIRKICEKE